MPGENGEARSAPRSFEKMTPRESPKQAKQSRFEKIKIAHNAENPGEVRASPGLPRQARRVRICFNSRPCGRPSETECRGRRGFYQTSAGASTAQEIGYLVCGQPPGRLGTAAQLCGVGGIESHACRGARAFAPSSIGPSAAGRRSCPRQFSSLFASAHLRHPDSNFAPISWKTYRDERP